jgi:hypothetical protein
MERKVSFLFYALLSISDLTLLPQNERFLGTSMSMSGAVEEKPSQHSLRQAVAITAQSSAAPRLTGSMA